MLGLSIPSVAYRNPASLAARVADLFRNGEQAVWFDPSDISTLYQDAAGTTPVTAMEQPVGLMLDKSKGLVLGPELVADTGFDNPAYWNAGAGWGVTGGQAVATAVVVGVAVFRAGIVSAGKTYQVTYTATVTSGGCRLESVSMGYTGVTRTTSGTYTEVIKPTTGITGNIAITAASGAFTGTIDNISVKELPGNHCTFKAGTGRPVLSARYNLLTYTEQFYNAAWVKAEASITKNAAVSPDGSMTADKFIPSANAGSHMMDCTFTATTEQCTAQVYVKLETDSAVDKITLYPGGISTFAHYNISANTTSKEANVVSNSITAVGNGWYKLQATWVAGVSIDRLRIYASSGSIGDVPTAGDGTSGIYIWGADLRPTNDGIGLPSYQRVVDSSTYDTAGFPAYLRADGTDDGGSTNSIAFTGTNKITVFAGVRKLSDAAKGIVAELSATTASNNGTFALTAPNAASATYGFESKGTALTDAIASAIAPISSVISASCGISTDSNVIRVNGTQADSDTGDQGTGNYGNYPLFLFARNNASSYFNGRLYSLIVLGRAATATEIANTERYLNQKGRLY